MKQALFILLSGLSLPLCAQETIFEHLSKEDSGQGTVIIHQDYRLKELVGKPIALSGAENENRASAQKVQGFRVQVYAGNNSQRARSEAHRQAERIRMLFPEIKVYTQFVSPRWLCRVGDFRTIEEADATMRKLKATGEFKELSIVRSTILL